LASLPAEAQSSISAALGRDLPEYEARPQGGGFEAQNTRHKLVADFTSAGVALRSGSALWGFALRGYGYGNALKAVGTVVPRASSNRVEYRRGPLTEWYVNGPAGLEQGFTIDTPLGSPGSQPLTIALALAGDLTPVVDPSKTVLVLTSHDGQALLCYRGLTARDASGKDLRAWLEVRPGQMLIRVGDERARYPVVIDPWVQLAKLVASDGEGADYFGGSVSISGDTVVVGAPRLSHLNGTGLAYVFVKPASGWANMTQTAELTTTDAGGPGKYDEFGCSVSISGNTIVVGADFGDASPGGGEGAAYVFVEPAGGWTNMTETAKLIASDAESDDAFGHAVAISGNTVVVGAPHWPFASSQQGAAYVFVEPTTGWTNMTETAKLTPSDGSAYDWFGGAVSADGDTLVVGASQNYSSAVGTGVAYVFAKPSSGWTNMNETAELAASDGVTGDGLGFSVSISGNTVVAGTPYATVGSNQSQGATYVFVGPASGWTNTTETAKLTASDGAAYDWLGMAVAVSGNMAVAGAPHGYLASSRVGAAYVFVEPANGWADVTQNAKLAASDGTTFNFFGGSVWMSGNTAVVGAESATIGTNGNQGAAYVFSNSPQAQIANLENTVKALVTAGTLSPGLGQFLLGPLNAALAALDPAPTNATPAALESGHVTAARPAPDRRHTAAAIRELNEFILRVRLLVIFRALKPAEGRTLIDAAESIIASLRA
jgi:hypothetical protein